MKSLVVVIFCVALMAIACNKNAGVADNCAAGYEPNKVCTEEFRTLMVRVVNSSGAAISLDSFKVMRVEDNQIIYNIKDVLPLPAPPGSYVLLSDAKMQETSRCGEDFEFKGYVDGAELAARVFGVAHDCCHINLISGDLKIVVEE